MSKIHPKVLAAFITGHIGTLAAVVLALFKVIPGDPRLVAFLGEALTLLHFGAGYATSVPASTAFADAASLISAARAGLTEAKTLTQTTGNDPLPTLPTPPATIQTPVAPQITPQTTPPAPNPAPVATPQPTPAAPPA